MQRINYVTNISIEQDGGGWSAMSKNVYLQLSKFCTINLIDGVNPKISFASRIESRIQRLAGVDALFPAYTEERLSTIAAYVDSKIANDCLFIFFHGSTPWIKVKSMLPYYCYLDASFMTYLKVYHRGIKFKTDKVMEAERLFIENAKAVFFSSTWSMEATRLEYKLQGSNFHTVGLGGNLSVREIATEEKNQFVFVGLDFHGKGGLLVAQAFQKLVLKMKDCCLLIVGAEPPPEVKKIPNVEYVGRLDKRKPDDLLRFQTVLSQSKALLLPTSRDMTPLVIIEAGYFGCPSLAADSYGIPEIIYNKKFLLAVPLNVDALANAMEGILRNRINRPAVKEFYQQNFNWDKTGLKIREVIG